MTRRMCSVEFVTGSGARLRSALDAAAAEAAGAPVLLVEGAEQAEQLARVAGHASAAALAAGRAQPRRVVVLETPALLLEPRLAAALGAALRRPGLLLLLPLAEDAPAAQGEELSRSRTRISELSPGARVEQRALPDAACAGPPAAPPMPSQPPASLRELELLAAASVLSSHAEVGDRHAAPAAIAAIIFRTFGFPPCLS